VPQQAVKARQSELATCPVRLKSDTARRKFEQQNTNATIAHKHQIELVAKVASVIKKGNLQRVARSGLPLWGCATALLYVFLVDGRKQR
jgi:hypothetical protein